MKVETGLALIRERRAALERACRQHRVIRLELFGSATAADRFDPHKSDLDFLVEFEEMSPEELADAYFGLLERLEDLFDLPVELVTGASAGKNPYFLDSIERNKIPVYAA